MREIILKIIITIISCIVLREFIIFSLSGNSDAQQSAERVFYNECNVKKLNCSDYKGPNFLGSYKNNYSFSWINYKTNNQILVSVFYLPYYTQVWNITE